MFLVVVKSPVNQAFLCHSDHPGFIQGIWLDNTLFLFHHYLRFCLYIALCLKKNSSIVTFLHCKFSPTPGLNFMPTERLVSRANQLYRS